VQAFLNRARDGARRDAVLLVVLHLLRAAVIEMEIKASMLCVTVSAKSTTSPLM
jgi:hypothetical protein